MAYEKKWYAAVADGHTWCHYRVHYDGTVVSLKRSITHFCRPGNTKPDAPKQYITRRYKQRTITHRINNQTGYYQARLSYDGYWKDIYVSRLVYESVTGERIPPDMEVDHIDSITSHNSFDNLQLLRRGHNVWKGRGTKLTPEILADVVARHDAGETSYDIAQIHGVSHGSINIWLSGRGQYATKLWADMGRSPFANRRGLKPKPDNK